MFSLVSFYSQILLSYMMNKEFFYSYDIITICCPIEEGTFTEVYSNA